MIKNSLSVVFLATPEFSISALKCLIENDKIDLKCVITKPDKPKGRGLKLTPPPVKVLALKHNIPVFQPKSLKKIELEKKDSKPFLKGETCKSLIDFLNSHSPIDLFIVSAYGKIIPSSFLSFPRLGNINIHPSLLPRWRGAAPIQRALFNGDKFTGVSIMKLDEGLDSGDIIKQEKIKILESDTLESLHDSLSLLGKELLESTLMDYLNNKVNFTPQDESKVTYAKKWEKEDSIINWKDKEEITLRRIRTCYPFLGARTTINNTLLKIFKAHKVENQNFDKNLSPGEIVECNQEELIVKASKDSYISIDEAQIEGKKRMDIKSLMRGFKFKKGDILL